MAMLCTVCSDVLSFLHSLFGFHGLQICRIVTTQALNVLTVLLEKQLINVFERESFGFGEEKVLMDIVSLFPVKAGLHSEILRTIIGSQVVFSTAKMI